MLRLQYATKQSRELTAGGGIGERDCGQTDPCSKLIFASLKRMPVRQVGSDNMRISPIIPPPPHTYLSRVCGYKADLRTVWLVFVVVKINDQFRKRGHDYF
jgi:hypothetical protein